MSAEETDLFDCARRVFHAPFAGVIVLEAEGDPPIFVDGRTGAPKVTRDGAGVSLHGEGCCAFRGQRETLLRVLESERQFAGAYVSGRLKIAGDLSVAARVCLGG